jgi:hypothetical protein
MKLSELRKLYVQYLDKLHSNNFGNFDPRLIHYDRLLKPKVDHMVGVLKLTSLLEKRSLAICDRQYT